MMSSFFCLGDPVYLAMFRQILRVLLPSPTTYCIVFITYVANSPVLFISFLRFHTRIKILVMAFYTIKWEKTASQGSVRLLPRMRRRKVFNKKIQSRKPSLSNCSNDVVTFFLNMVVCHNEQPLSFRFSVLNPAILDLWKQYFPFSFQIKIS